MTWIKASEAKAKAAANPPVVSDVLRKRIADAIARASREGFTACSIALRPGAESRCRNMIANELRLDGYWVYGGVKEDIATNPVMILHIDWED